MEGLKIVGSGVLGAVLYGVLHDEVTARICVESFTIGHPRILAKEHHVSFIAVLWAHWASDLSGVVGALALVWSVSRVRRLQRAGVARSDVAAELDAR